MKRQLKTHYIFSLLLAFGAQAKENVNHNGGGVTSPLQTLAYNCAVGTAQTLLDINNVKTTILNGGDMWWDLSNGRYEIPKDLESILCLPVHYGLVVMMITVSLRLQGKLTNVRY